MPAHPYSRHARVFDFLSGRTSLGILQALHGGEKNVLALQQHLEAPQERVSQSLQRLRLANLVSMRESGKYHYYKLKKPEIITALEHVNQVAVHPEVRKPVTSILFALAEPTRIRILELLGKKPMSVIEITKELSMNQPAVSKNLGILSFANLVSFEKRQQRYNYYHLVDPRILQAIEAMKQALAE